MRNYTRELAECFACDVKTRNNAPETASEWDRAGIVELACLEIRVGNQWMVAGSVRPSRKSVINERDLASRIRLLAS